MLQLAATAAVQRRQREVEEEDLASLAVASKAREGNAPAPVLTTARKPALAAPRKVVTPRAPPTQAPITDFFAGASAATATVGAPPVPVVQPKSTSPECKQPERAECQSPSDKGRRLKSPAAPGAGRRTPHRKQDEIVSPPRRSRNEVPTEQRSRPTDRKVDEPADGITANPHQQSRKPVFRMIRPAFWRRFTALCRGYLQRYTTAHQNQDEAVLEDVLLRIFNIPQCALLKCSLRAINKKLQWLLETDRSNTAPPAQVAPMIAADNNDEKQPEITNNQAAAVPIAANPDADTETIGYNDDSNPNEVTCDSIAADSKPLDESGTRACVRACAIVREGAPHCLSRGCRQMLQKEPTVAECTPEVIAEMMRLNPEPSTDPSRISAAEVSEPLTIDVDTLRKVIKRRINNGSAPGPSGWTGHHLQTLMGDDDCAQGIACLISDICHGRFQRPEIRRRILGSMLVAISKSNGKLRPVAVGEVFYKAAAHYEMARVEKDLPKMFPSIQYGVASAGGSELAAQLIQQLRNTMSQCQKGSNSPQDPGKNTESQPQDIIALATDFNNAFNACSRTQIWEALHKQPLSAPVWKLFQYAYSSSTPLMMFNRQGKLTAVIESKEGVRQGDPLAAFCFALAVQPLYEQVIAGLNVKAIAIQDDLTLIGPADQVWQAYDRLVKEAPKYHLSLEANKCQVLLPAAHDHHEAIRAAASQRNIGCTDSLMKILGTMMTCEDENLIEAECLDAADSHQLMFERLAHPLMRENGNSQIGTLLLRYCAIPRLHYLCRTTKPQLMHRAAGRFDRAVMATFGKLTGMDCARLSDAQRLQITLPLGDGGMGMRPISRITHAAYCSSLLLALTELIPMFPQEDFPWAQSDMCQQLQVCKDALLAMGVDLQNAIGFGLLDQPLETLWQRLKAMLAEVFPDGSKPVIRIYIEFGLQKALTAAIESQLLKELNANNPSLPDTTRLLALSTSSSSRGLCVIPTEKYFRLSTMEMDSLVRHRLGMLPTEAMSGQRCHCNRRVSFNSCPSHLHSCQQLRRTAVTIRHNMIVYTLAAICRAAGCDALVEPDCPLQHSQCRGQQTHRGVPGGLAVDDAYDDDDDDSDAQSDCGETLPYPAVPALSELGIAPSDSQPTRHARRADLLVTGVPDFCGFVDVSVTHPIADFLLRQHAARVSTVRLHAAKLREKAKQRHYAVCPHYRGRKVVPFVLETYGGVGAKAAAYLKLLANRTDHPKQFYAEAMDRLAITLVKGNALVDQLGMHRVFSAELLAAHHHAARTAAAQFAPPHAHQHQLPRMWLPPLAA